MPRWLLPTLIVVATALFVTGVVIEHNSDDKHVETSSSTAAESGASGGEGEEAHSEGEEAGGETAEHAPEPATHEADEGGEVKLFGIDVESTPLVALAALASIGLALAAWLRPSWAALLTLIAVALVAFAALDIREVFQQLDEDKAGLVVLAALVGVLHLAASGVAVATRQHTPA
jgi:hypothetical protein